MELSSVLIRIHYLLELKDATKEDRIIMLQSITHGQMDCIAEIARRIYNQTFPLLTRDLTYFENRNLILRVLISERVSFRRKVNTLVRNHSMIPRLFRTYYLQATIQDQIRTQREA